jgi:hypothetical protein
MSLTHEVFNQSSPLVDVNLYDAHPALQAAVDAFHPGADRAPLRALGAEMGSAAMQAHARLGEAGDAGLAGTSFDEAFFGAALAPRRLDTRIAAVVEAIRRDPSAPSAAQACAAAAGLSFSRFLRSLRTWKRARSLLRHVNRPSNLADVALVSGYPDSTHFSHSIRQVYGLTPRDLFAGSRDLVLVGREAVARGATVHA